MTMLKVVSLDFVLAVICTSWIASAERKSPDLPEAAIAAGKESDALLADVGDMFDQDKGPFVSVIDDMKKADKATRRSARDWVLKPYEAAKAAGRVVTESTKRTQHVVMHDALKLDSKIKGDFGNTMLELHPQHLGSDEIQKVVSEHGGDRRPMVFDDQHIINGTRVLINSNYNGPDFRRVQHHKGTISDFRVVDGVPKWKVKLDSGINFQPELVVKEFEMLPDRDITAEAIRGSVAAEDFGSKAIGADRQKAPDRYSGEHANVKSNIVTKDANAQSADKVSAPEGKLINKDLTASASHGGATGSTADAEHDGAEDLDVSGNQLEDLGESKASEIMGRQQGSEAESEADELRSRSRPENHNIGKLKSPDKWGHESMPARIKIHVKESAANVRDKTVGTLSRAGKKAEAAARRTKDALATAKQRSLEAAAKTAESVRHGASATKQHLSNAADTMKNGARNAKEAIVDKIDKAQDAVQRRGRSRSSGKPGDLKPEYRHYRGI